MAKTDNIYLIGPMGSGKTSVGKQLAQLMHLPFYDSDNEIERQTGVTISWIFELEGEDGFRQRETQAIKKLTSMNKIILSTGGGCVMTENNRRALKENGTVIYLQVSLSEQLARTTQRQGVRPLLAVNPEEKLTELNRIRHPLYHSIADFVYQTDQFTPQQLAERIFHDVSQQRGPKN